MNGMFLAIGWIFMMVINLLAFMNAVLTNNDVMAFVTAFTLAFNIIAFLEADKDRNEDKDKDRNKDKDN